MAKILNKNELVEQIRSWRQENKVIVFTNGCFDILHRGHVEYIEKAKVLGDILIIGLNSDQSVRRLKGAGRPFVQQSDRAYILSRLSAVDAVCIFDDDTPFRIINLVQPDILVKGGDYDKDNIVGRDIVEGKGGEVVVIPLVSGRSTTDLITKIRKANTGR